MAKTTTAQEEFENFKLTNNKYLELELAAMEEIAANELLDEEEFTTMLQAKGYTGNATTADWNLFFERNGGKGVYGNHISTLAIQLNGDKKEFKKKFKETKDKL